MVNVQWLMMIFECLSEVAQVNRGCFTPGIQPRAGRSGSRIVDKEQVYAWVNLAGMTVRGKWVLSAD